MKHLVVCCIMLCLVSCQKSRDGQTVSTRGDEGAYQVQNPSGDEHNVVTGDAAALSKDVSMVRDLGVLNGYDYRCARMVEVVNHLRHLGKSRCLAILKKSIADTRDNNKVLAICRLLFVNPTGWAPMTLGKPYPAINETVAKKWPFFPIGLSQGVPFVFVVGYAFHGKGVSAFTCLKLCDHLDLVDKDYPLTGYKKAAHALIQRKSFRELYKKEDAKKMADMILGQAIHNYQGHTR